ncbi:unnamed protein product [Brassica oleracea var. botrytis]
MEVLSTINLLALVLLPFVVPRIWEAYWLILLRPCMDDNKKIQETRNLRSKIQIRVRKPQEIKKMKKEANCWVLDSNSNDIFPRHDKGMVDCTLRMLEEWRIHNCGEEVMMRMEINKDYHRLISDIIATTAFGSSYEEGIELFRSQSELEEYFVASLTSVFIPGKQCKAKIKFHELWRQSSRDQVESCNI